MGRQDITTFAHYRCRSTKTKTQWLSIKEIVINQEAKRKKINLRKNKPIIEKNAATKIKKNKKPMKTNGKLVSDLGEKKTKKKLYLVGCGL